MKKSFMILMRQKQNLFKSYTKGNGFIKTGSKVIVLFLCASSDDAKYY